MVAVIDHHFFCTRIIFYKYFFQKTRFFQLSNYLYIKNINDD